MKTVLIESITDVEADGYYFGGFKSMDPVTLLGTLEKPVCLIHRMEMERARNEGRFAAVYDLVDYLDKAKAKVGKRTKAAAIALLADELGYGELTVPQHYPVALYNALQELGVSLRVETGLLFPEREIKSAEEVAHCRTGARISEAGFARVRDILTESTIGDDDTVRFEGDVLTCEQLRREIRLATSAVGGGTNNPIAASGLQGADCHCIGFGPVKANELIVVDIFPRDDDSYYYGDLSRTFLKGVPTEKQQHIHDTVLTSLQAALGAMGPGKRLAEADRLARDVLKEAGYETRLREDGKWEGCYCGIGHGVGLDVHEGPYLGHAEGEMVPGHVITV